MFNPISRWGPGEGGHYNPPSPYHEFVCHCQKVRATETKLPDFAPFDNCQVLESKFWCVHWSKICTHSNLILKRFWRYPSKTICEVKILVKYNWFWMGEIRNNPNLDFFFLFWFFFLLSTSNFNKFLNLVLTLCGTWHLKHPTLFLKKNLWIGSHNRWQPLQNLIRIQTSLKI